MKKLTLILCIILSICSLSACTSEKEDYQNVSKIENFYFIGESETFTVTITGGQKETPTVFDGSAGKLSSYAVITLEVNSGYATEYSYLLGVSEEGFSGTFQEEIVGGNLYAEIEVADFPETEYKITISYNDQKEEIYLESVVSEDMIKWNEAKAIAQKELASNIEEMQTETSDNYESYIKLVYDRENQSASWYVAFCNEEELCAVLIDPITGDVIAKRI